MERIRINKYFFLDEYIPEELYKKLQHKPHILLGLLDKEMLKADLMLRELFGPITINNWWNGGSRNWSGIRTPDSPYYSSTSQHTYGRASDKIFSNVSAEEVREYIKVHWKELGITCIEERPNAPEEDDIEWLHSDTRYWHGD